MKKKKGFEVNNTYDPNYFAGQIKSQEELQGVSMAMLTLDNKVRTSILLLQLVLQSKKHLSVTKIWKTVHQLHIIRSTKFNL